MTNILTDVTERQALMLWTSIVEPGDGMAYDFIAEHPSALAALTTLVTKDRLDEFTAADADYIGAFERWLPRLAQAEIQRLELQAVRFNAGFLTRDDDAWPVDRLDRLGRNQPLGLWYRGNASLLTTDTIAIVGARAATGYGEHVTMELSSGLVDRGYTIVSGAAYGVDGMAHRAALASRGGTIAVLAGGVDRFYPSGHDALLSRIVEAGLVISELPPGSSPTKWRFLQRNRIIAALSEAVVVTEAGFRSGSLNTAGHAKSAGIPVAAYPGAVTSAASAGCHHIIREGIATLVTSADEVAELAPLAEKFTTVAEV